MGNCPREGSQKNLSEWTKKDEGDAKKNLASESISRERKSCGEIVGEITRIIAVFGVNGQRDGVGLSPTS